MNKEERIQYLQEEVDKGNTFETLVPQAAKLGGVKESTVINDLKELYPEGDPNQTAPRPEAEHDAPEPHGNDKNPADKPEGMPDEGKGAPKIVGPTYEKPTDPAVTGAESAGKKIVAQTEPESGQRVVGSINKIEGAAPTTAGFLTARELSNPELKKGRLNSYKPKENELDVIHVELEKVAFDHVTGEKKSRPFVQMFDPTAWVGFERNAKSLGYTHMRVLYKPEEKTAQ